MLILFELLTFFLYISATPSFLCLYKVLGYESLSERMHRSGLKEKTNILESKYRMDLYDYCMESIKVFSISFMEVIATIIVLLYQYALPGQSFDAYDREGTYLPATIILLLANIFMMAASLNGIFKKKVFFHMTDIKLFIVGLVKQVVMIVVLVMVIVVDGKELLLESWLICNIIFSTANIIWLAFWLKTVIFREKEHVKSTMRKTTRRF